MALSTRTLRVALACGALTAAQANVHRIDVSAYTSLKLKLPEHYDQANLALEWEVVRSETSSTTLEVELPSFADVGDLIEGDNPRQALLPLSFDCSLSPMNVLQDTPTPTRFPVSFSLRGAGSVGLAWLLALVLGVFGSIRSLNGYQQPWSTAAKACLAASVCALALVVAGASEPDCASFGGGNTPTKLKLHVPSNQWAQVNSCGFCAPEDMRRYTYFVWRDPCDVMAAVSALNAAANSCGTEKKKKKGTTSCALFNKTFSGRTVCGLDNWCSNFLDSPGEPPGCYVPASVGDTCMHRSLEYELKANLTAAGADLLESTLRCAVESSPVAGRPYTTEEGALLAPAQMCSERDVGQGGAHSRWSTAASTSVAEFSAGSGVLTSWTPQMAEHAASEWLRHGQEEHASIASFSRFSMDLLRFAAPAHLLLAVHQAAADEVRHASSAFSLAVRFREGSIFSSTSDKTKAESIEVGTFPVAKVDLSSSLHALATRTLIEGCLGEGAAVTRLAFTLAHVDPKSPAKVLLEELFADECEHAALAWAALRWAVRQGAIADSFPEHLLSKSGPQTPKYDDARLSSDPMFTWAGLLPPDLAQKASSLVLLHWVLPWMRAGLLASVGELTIPEESLLPEGDLPLQSPWSLALSAAATRVRAHLLQLEALADSALSKRREWHDRSEKV